MTQLSQQEFLDHFIELFKNNGVPSIDIKTTVAVTQAIEKKVSLIDFTKYIYINNLQNKYTGIFVADFKRKEVDILIKLVESYNGLHHIITNKLDPIIDDIYIEDNQLYAVFLNPIDTYKFYLNMIKDKKD
tara:strand:+ start:691 stop:1083 length:393 start_codon:yes stop_codon:yes gene_type:complete